MSIFLKKYATPFSLVTFAAVGATGLMMFFGLRNHDLGELHEKFGLLFVVAIILHLCRNGGGLGLMLSSVRSKLVIGVFGAVAILLIGSAVVGGGFGPPQGDRGPHGPQMQLALRLSFTPINQLAPAFGLSSSQVIARLRKGGVSVNGPGQNLSEISQKQGVDVPHLLDMIAAEPGS